MRNFCSNNCTRLGLNCPPFWDTHIVDAAPARLCLNPRLWLITETPTQHSPLLHPPIYLPWLLALYTPLARTICRPASDRPPRPHAEYGRATMHSFVIPLLIYLRGEIACAECRRLKIKCDKNVPCATCVKRGCGALCPNGKNTVQSRLLVLLTTPSRHNPPRRWRPVSDTLFTRPRQFSNITPLDSSPRLRNIFKTSSSG